jgi:hypothetical protein
MTPSPTPVSILRNALQGIDGLLDLSHEEEVEVRIPRFYSVIRKEQLEAVLIVIDASFSPSATRRRNP